MKGVQNPLKITKIPGIKRVKTRTVPFPESCYFGSMKHTLILFALPLSLFSQSLQHDLDSIMRQTFTADQPGGGLLIAEGNQILYQNAIGLRDLESKKKLTARSNFRMASVTKQFTAAAILILEKQGKLSLSDPIRTFFPEFAPVGNSITIGQLLNHSSGIWAYESVMPDDLTEQLSDADVLNLIKDIDKTYFPPGTNYRYSNSGYCLLALLVERASGQSFAEFLKQEIFQPAGMKRTQVYTADARIRKRVYGFARDAQGQIVWSDQSLTSATKGDGGVYTSLEDYQKWNEALLANQFFDLEYLLRQTGTSLPDGSSYSLGWFYRDTPENGMVMFHSGSTCGFSNLVIRLPKQGIAIACFSNIANNHKTFQPVLDYLTKAGILQTDIWDWHDLTD